MPMSNTLNIQHISEMDRGLAYAEACFETFRIIEGEVFQWSEHWQRIALGLKALGIEADEAWAQQIFETCLHQAKQTSTDCLVRLTISGGDAAWGLTLKTQPKAYIQVTPYIFKNEPIRTISVEYPFPLREKLAKYTSDYGEMLRAIQLWKVQHQDVSPHQFILCKDGYVLGGLTSNILLYHQGKWLTPEGNGVLHGTMRQYLQNKKLIHAAKCTVDLLQTCEAALFLNSGQFLRPLQSINTYNKDTRHNAIIPIQIALKAEKGVKLEHL